MLSLKQLFLCIIFMIAGPSLIFLNKYILSDLQFNYPIFLSALGVVVSALTANLIVLTGGVALQSSEKIKGVLWFKRVLPVGLAHAGTLAFGNTVYLYLNVGFIQMLKSFTPVIIMITGYFFGVDKPSKYVVFAVVVITIGTAATCSFTPELSILGIFIMFMSELTEAIRLILIQFLLQNLSFGVVEGQYFLAPATAFWLFALSAYFEFSDMLEKGALLIILEYPFHFLAASFMGLVINFLSYFVIQVTSGLTMKILGTLRNVLTIVVGVVVYQENIVLNEAIGYSIALLGFVIYNAAKMGMFEHKKESLIPT